MRNDRRRDFEKEVPEFKERLVFINRVAKVVKGGKNYRFTALMVVGNDHINTFFACDFHRIAAGDTAVNCYQYPAITEHFQSFFQ